MVSKGKAAKSEQDINEDGTQAVPAKAEPAKAAPTQAGPAKDDQPLNSPLTTLILTDIAMSAGSALLARGVAGKGLAGRVLGKALPVRTPGGLIRGPSLVGSLVGTAIARVATRSVPGAIVVGGGLVAKALYDRRKTRRARAAVKAKPR
ncbi:MULTISPECIES: hypothetical protein [unclassified Novosphingobium]|uniref:hypothetical protein n=1 Tax=unclassified Novosphingobium TaxID=2644732 RepID=UPI001494502D|nr:MULTISPECIES: hypothetical protein [unclassified Novosphingobium]MBB3356609.1 hypothetical protein [Novosphingobium sp. BK256]MBB3373010.1 hypothetical protein [Novosphingobium sp. BK280]MBB3377378.1 hypothetical protein [Novosphingobium sp. BK258]MBB3419211.1 hypothetical protein [Novosphingobium sp. BK267]MBB3448972.1 hypothetical protein [Novosphingobium sp. BK352]